MARIPSRQIDEFQGKLIIEIDYVETAVDADDMPLFVYVYYQPSPERLKQSGKNTDDLNSYKKKILEICGHHNFLSIYPLNKLRVDYWQNARRNRPEEIL